MYLINKIHYFSIYTKSILLGCVLFFRPDLIDMDTVAVQSNITNLETAFYVAEKLGVTRLLDPEGTVAFLQGLSFFQKILYNLGLSKNTQETLLIPEAAATALVFPAELHR